MIPLLTAVTLLASAVVGGVFFAFSSFVMPALGNVPPTAGIRAMQRINIDVFTRSFEIVFFGTPLLCAAVAALAVVHWGEPGSAWLLAGGAVYLTGCLLVTGVGNVPLNNQLAAAPADSDEAREFWPSYLSRWTIWNHVRTVACIAAALLFGAGLWRG